MPVEWKLGTDTGRVNDCTSCTVPCCRSRVPKAPTLSAVVAALALVLMTCRRFSPVPPAQMADAITPAFPFAMAITRVGCFLSGCCGGKLCELPWAVQFPAATQVWGAQHRAGLVDPAATLSLHVHPLQIYFGMFSLAVGIFILWFFPKRRYDGQVFLVFIAVQGIGKFMLESLRFVEMPEIRNASLFLGLAALGILGLKARSREGSVCGLPHVPGAWS